MDEIEIARTVWKETQHELVQATAQVAAAAQSGTNEELAKARESYKVAKEQFFAASAYLREAQRRSVDDVSGLHKIMSQPTND